MRSFAAMTTIGAIAMRIAYMSDLHRSFSLALGAVSLFDFGPAARDDSHQVAHLVGWFGSQQKARTAVWLELDRALLGPGLLDAAAARAMWRPDTHSRFIPGFEACHRGPIPVRAIGRVLLIARDARHRFRVVGRLSDDLPRAIESFEASPAEASPARGRA